MPAAIAVPLIVGAASAGASVYASKKNASTGERAARYQTDAANHAADLESIASQQQLDFVKQQEAQRQKEWQATQDRNYSIYQDETRRDDDRYNAQVARREPFRQFGVGAIAQLGQPIPGSLGAMIGGRQ